MAIRQSVITGAILAFSGLGTLAIGIIFCRYSQYQLIGVCAFEAGFENDVVTGKLSYNGDRGFQLLEPVGPLPTATEFFSAENTDDQFPEGDDADPALHAGAEKLQEEPKGQQGQGGGRLGHQGQGEGKLGQQGRGDGRVSPQGPGEGKMGGRVEGAGKQGQGDERHGQQGQGQGQTDAKQKQGAQGDGKLGGEGQGHKSEEFRIPLCTMQDPVHGPGSRKVSRGRSDEPLDKVQEPSRFAKYLIETNSSLLVKSPLGSHLLVKSYILRFWQTSVVAIFAALVKIGVSLAFVFMKEKSIRSMSAFFYSYLFVFLSNLTCLCIVLYGKPNQHNSYLSHENYRRATGDIFALILGFDCLIILIFTILTCLTCNTEEYSDRCIDEDTCNRTRSISAAHMLNAAAASSTDRLNN